MNDCAFYSLARDDFGKLRKREVIARILSLLKAQKTEMLSLGDVRSLLKPESETYRGMQTVPIAKIVGSEGRYKDFNREFLPRHDKLMRRWMRVDVAHYANVILPPIKLFEIGGRVLRARRQPPRVRGQVARGGVHRRGGHLALHGDHDHARHVGGRPATGRDRLRADAILRGRPGWTSCAPVAGSSSRQWAATTRSWRTSASTSGTSI